MLRKTLCTVSLLCIGACCVAASEAQKPSTSLPAKEKPLAKLTAAQQQENLALDLALNHLRNHAWQDANGPHREKLLFDSKAWPTYRSQLPQIILGDLSLVDKHMEREEARQKMASVDKILFGRGLWQTAFRELHPDYLLYVRRCTFRHMSNTLHIELAFGPSAHGAEGIYDLKTENGTWKITKSEVGYFA